MSNSFQTQILDLDHRVFEGLCKTGDVLIPGDQEFPRFSQTNFITQIDRMMNYMTDEDREGFLMLMKVMRLLPKSAIKLLFWLCDHQAVMPSFLGAVFRMIDLGVKGVIFTLYYSNIDDAKGDGSKIFKNMHYHATINTQIKEHDEMQDLISLSNPLENSTNAKTGNLQNSATNSSAMLTEVFHQARHVHLELRQLPLSEKISVIKKLKSVILAQQEYIIDVIQRDTKKSRSDALFSEIFPLLEHLDFLISNVKKALQDEAIHTPIVMLGKSSKIFYEPLGTVLIIAPWNYPFYQAITPITCSFMASNATIFKPSELTPLTGLVEQILSAAGFKSSWAQVVYGDGVVGSQLIDQRPQKIFFTGSVTTGKKIMAQAAQYLIPVELELGGKDPMIVFDDVNVERAVRGAAWGAFTNAGQSCTSVERLYVQENIYEDFKQKLVAESKRIKVSIDSDGDSDFGYMTSKDQVMKIAELLKDAISQGAKMLTGFDWDFKSEKIPPIILEGTTHQMRINQEEIFGPVLPIMKFSTEAQAISLANDSTFGLSASVWTKDKERAIRVSRALETGNVSINNVMLSEGNHALPFGGVKNSGIGRFKGIMGLRSFCNVKSILVDADSSKIEANWYPYTAKKYKIFSKLTAAFFTGGFKGLLKFAILGLKLEMYSGKVGKSGRPDV